MSTIAYARSTPELVQIAVAGGSFWMDPYARSTPELIQIATAAKTGGGTVTIMGTYARSTQELVQISVAGKGHVVFAPTSDFFKEK